MSENDETARYDLVMPFVVCRSRGGPYDDQAFTAGWWCGQADTTLSAAPEECDRLSFSVGVPSLLAPQLDLIAMSRGFTLVHELYGDDDEFMFIRFDRGAPDEASS